MSKEAIQMNRTDWENVREYRKTPFKIQYFEHLKKTEGIEYKKDQI